MSTFFIIIYIFCIALVAGTAKKNNKNPFNWIMLSLLLTPILAGLILFVKSRPMVSEEKEHTENSNNELIANSSQADNNHFTFTFRDIPSLSIDELKQYKKELKTNLKGIRQLLKENSRLMSEIRTRSSLSKIKGARSRGITGVLNIMNTIGKDASLKPLQAKKEELLVAVTRFEREILNVESKEHLL